MHRAAMASRSARTSVDHLGASFEALESRLVLSAPTVTPLLPVVDSGGVDFPILYQSDLPMASTLGSYITVTGPGGFEQFGLWNGSEAGSNGGVVVHYYARPPGGVWNWTTSNGTYNVTIAADAVRNTAGEGNAAGGVASYWFWFTPQLDIIDQQVKYGRLTNDPFYPDPGYDYDGWTIRIRQTTGYPEAGRTMVIHVTGPNGYDTSAGASEDYPFSYIFPVPRPQPSNEKILKGTASPPGGTWDFADGGVYTVEVGSPAPDSTPFNPRMGTVMATRTFTLNIDPLPHPEVIASQVRIHDWLLTVRYTAAPGASISLASITDGDIQAGPTLVSTLFQPATRNADGSVTAVYAIQAPGSGGWSNANSGSYLVSTRPQQVVDSAGRAVGIGGIAPVYNLYFPQSSIIGLRTISAVINAWDLELSFRNTGGALNSMTLSGANLSVYAYINGVFQLAPVNVQFLSSANSPDNILAARYRITAQQGFLWDGTYWIRTNTQTMNGYWWLSLNQPLVMHFEGPSVTGLRTVNRTATAWDVQVSFRNISSLISTSSLSGQNLLIAAPGGRAVRVAMLSFANGSDGVLRVRYRVTATTSGTMLWHGTYGFSLRGGSVMAAGVGLPGQFLANMTI